MLPFIPLNADAYYETEVSIAHFARLLIHVLNVYTTLQIFIVMLKYPHHLLLLCRWSNLHHFSYVYQGWSTWMFVIRLKYLHHFLQMFVMRLKYLHHFLHMFVMRLKYLYNFLQMFVWGWCIYITFYRCLLWGWSIYTTFYRCLPFLYSFFGNLLPVDVLLMYSSLIWRKRDGHKKF